MKKIAFLLLPSFVLVLHLFCKKNLYNVDCVRSEQVVPFDTLPSLQQYWLKNIEETKDEINLSIQSYEDYEKYIGSDKPLPHIDFSKQFLLTGRVKLSACGRLKEQRIILQCDKLKYTVTTEAMACQKPTDVFFFALIDIKYKTYSIDFKTLKL